MGHAHNSESADRYWQHFCRAHGVDRGAPLQIWHFGDSPELAKRLVELVVNGPKRATASLRWVYDRQLAPMPIVGEYNVLTEHDGTPRAVTRTTHVEERAFCDVDAAFAFEEGEGDRSLAYWRAAHWRFFSPECEALGISPTEDMPIILERFELLHPCDTCPPACRTDPEGG